MRPINRRNEYACPKTAGNPALDEKQTKFLPFCVDSQINRRRVRVQAGCF